MNDKPVKPLDAYPPATPEDLPPLPPADAPDRESAPSRPPHEIAVLQFVDPGAVSRTVPLRHPFIWGEKVIDAITVRRLSVAEVGLITEEMIAAKDFDLYRYYEAMAGFPAPVLRGLIADDGEDVINTAIPFLPRIVQDMTPGMPESDPASPSRTASGNGDDTPSPPPDP